MCGIVGFVGPPDPTVLDRMRDALAHRGPDGAGSVTEGRVSLGHRRLSIVDLGGGAQPMRDADGDLTVVFNGEIYNHPRLRRRLESRGAEYRTGCDTESILHAYRAHGRDCPRELDGMFAFVLHDRRRGVLFGARDRFGKKPLHYVHRPHAGGRSVSFAFASEIKALRRHPDLRREFALSADALESYLLHDYVAGPQSIHRGVRRLPRGSAFELHLATGALKTWTWWRPADEPTVDVPDGVGPAAARLAELLTEATRSRLMSDVPVGAFLSGGIDSSAIVHRLTTLRPAAEIDTFAIGFDDADFDESHHAAAVAAALGTRHHSRRFTAADLTGRLPALVEGMDEPFADPSLLPFSLLCEFAREHVKVAVGGDGGDELLAGYDPFRAVRPARLYHRLVPGFADRLVERASAALLGGSAGNVALDFKVRRFLRGAGVPEPYRYAAWMGPFAPTTLPRLMPGRPFRSWRRSLPLLADPNERTHAAGGLGPALDFFERIYLTDDILVKLDRGSMMHSLEVRSPFLDTALAEYCHALPDRWKQSGRLQKVLLREAADRHLPGFPKAVLDRPKKGFGIPVARWIREDLAADFRDTLLGDWPVALDVLHQPEAERLLRRHLAGAENHYKELWALYVLVKWARRHL